MNDRYATVSEIEKYILFLDNIRKNDPEASNISLIDKNQNFHSDVMKTDYWRYLGKGDYHYFISRILFLHYIGEYSFFSAQQCVENYLKGYLRSLNEKPPNTHDLKKILDVCKTKTSDTSSFIHSEFLDVIVQRFNPFNEIARYPVQIMKTKTDTYGFVFPRDIYVLDYFIYKMREILPLPNNVRDVLKDSLMELEFCKKEFPEFYEKFKENNINFKESTQE